MMGLVTKHATKTTLILIGIIDGLDCFEMLTVKLANVKLIFVMFNCLMIYVAQVGDCWIFW